MRRREFLFGMGLTGAALTRPLIAHAQQAMPEIGFLNTSSAWTLPDGLSAFLKGLGETGFVDGQNVRIEYRWAEGDADRLPAMAADLVHRQVAVIAAARHRLRPRWRPRRFRSCSKQAPIRSRSASSPA